ncbi:molybdopterin-containing oxidoreductase family protein [Campylobacter geochelonis]|uniref:Anaerobic dehydrogenase n=1 Tax=Campylobacter geochelonis TaxID=1780362 RepID=A0A128EJJ7_9BACT|nr:molybdopterin-dependent oxidoreductase [Campylobacter geochelonis]QKF71398.1 molybdopterin-dependent oxidoreductase, catalytic subunit [Campylobacter geochelonis]CZE47734.1 anaerobic dehydrogenase [Campylobacter geochelonis]CZE48423.1 anaerobic dehydrogenase [Campylobacter geochelonis]CZE50901.1 anaerobic dehydrogenase [Campylobacter geochelonis]
MQNANRRDFLKGIGALGVSVPLFGMTSIKDEEVLFKPKKPRGDSKFHYVTCPRNCRDACCLVAEVQDGVMIDIKGAKWHPVTQGTACCKGHTYREYLYATDRILYPMKRAGKKGEGKWERISWDEAFSLTATKFNEIIKEYGGEAIAEFVYSGNEGHISKTIAPGNFFEKIGATRLVRNPCDWPRYAGTPSVIGTSFSKDALEFNQSDMYITWGSNEAYTAVHWAKIGQDVRRRGGKLITINTIRTPMANHSDMFIQLKPCTDSAFCLGVCKVLIEENLYDKEFVEKYTMGFDDLVAETKEYTLEYLADFCGIKVDEIVTFAREYAKAKAPAISHGDGGQRHFNGARLVRAVTFLPVLIGALTKPGAGLFWAYTNLTPCYDFDKVMPDLSPKDENGKKIERQTANYVQFGRALRTDNPTSLDTSSDSYKEVKLKTVIRAVINYNTNLMVTAPNTALIKKRLLQDDLFLLVLDPFDTDTVDYADIVMPAGTFLESEDIQNDQVSGFICYNAAAAKLVGESKTNLEIFNGIAKAMGFTDECFDWDSRYILSTMLDTKFNKEQNIDYERAVVKGQIKPIRTPQTMKEHFPYYPYHEEGNLVFKTPSGKCELYSQHFKDEGFHPVIDLGTDEDWYKNNKDFGEEYLKKYPLYFMTPGTQLQDNTNWGNVKYIKHRVLYDGYPEIFMTQADTSARGIKEGDVVKATNELASAYFRVRVISQMKPGICYAWNNIWLKTTKTRTGANFLCSDGISDLGQGSVYTATYVEVAKSTDLE